MAFLDPKQVIRSFDVSEGMQVGDFGAGTGAYAFALSEKVGTTGRVYAIDVQKELLSTLQNEAKRRRLQNIEIVWSDFEKVNGVKLRDGIFSRALVANVMFQLKDKKAFLEELKRLVRSGGKILVIDWADSYGNMGPHKDHVFSELTAKKVFTDEGFVFEDFHDAGAHHWGLIFKRP